jgi:hypothetical protein
MRRRELTESIYWGSIGQTTIIDRLPRRRKIWTNRFNEMHKRDLSRAAVICTEASGHPKSSRHSRKTWQPSICEELASDKGDCHGHFKFLGSIYLAT